MILMELSLVFDKPNEQALNKKQKEKETNSRASNTLKYMQPATLSSSSYSTNIALLILTSPIDLQEKEQEH